MAVQCLSPRCVLCVLCECPARLTECRSVPADHVEISGSSQVTVCRDSVRGRCGRPRCKYYHLPVVPAAPGEQTAAAAALGLQLL